MSAQAWQTVKVTYRQESDGAWIGTSPEIPGFLACGDTYEGARDQADDGLCWFAERDDLVLVHCVLGLGLEVCITRNLAGSPKVVPGMLGTPTTSWGTL